MGVDRCHSHAYESPVHHGTFLPSHRDVSEVARGFGRTSAVVPAENDLESDDWTTACTRTSHVQGAIVSVFVH